MEKYIEVFFVSRKVLKLPLLYERKKLIKDDDKKENWARNRTYHKRLLDNLYLNKTILQA